jgi:apolipoprotein N-acyltransferase
LGNILFHNFSKETTLLKNKMLRAFFVIAASLSTAGLMALCFPASDLGWLAWISLVPLLVSISGEKPHFGFFLAFICGLVFFPGIGNWLFQVHGYRLLHHAIWGTYLAIYFGLFGLAFSVISRRWGVVSSLVASPFLWVSLEYIRSNMGFMAFPWGLLSHSQHQYPRIIQVASLAGNYGVSFLVVWVNAALAAVILLYARPSALKYSARHASILVVIGGALITSSFWYGDWIVSKPIIGNEIRVSVVQGNISQKKKWDPTYANWIMETYADLTREASKDRPDLIVWPEAATPHAITMDVTLYRQVRDIAAKAGTYLLLGSTHQDKIRTKGQGGFKYANSAFLISHDGKENDKRYDKIRLLPFGEYLPMRGIIPWFYIRIPDPGSYRSGQELTVFECSRYRFSVTICWETIFPNLVRGFVKRGAQFLVNITNEAWFGKSEAPYQFLSMNVFRAVENSVYVVRCANTGISCFIDPFGRVVDRVKDQAGQDIFVQGVLTKTILAMEPKTIYTRYGDWFAWLCILASVFAVILTCFKRSTRYHSSL